MPREITAKKMMRTLFTLLCCLTILLAQPGLAKACISAREPGRVNNVGEEYYQLGDKRFPVEQSNEFRWQKYPNIVIARVASVTDADGNTVTDYTTNPRARKRAEPEYQIPKPPLTFHYGVQKVYKGNLVDTFMSLSKGWGYGGSCNAPVRPGEVYIWYLPDLPTSGDFQHQEITYLSGPPRWFIPEDPSPTKVVILNELRAWLEKRKQSDVPLDNKGEEISPP